MEEEEEDPLVTLTGSCSQRRESGQLVQAVEVDIGQPRQELH
jgi:hypothetical protein